MFMIVVREHVLFHGLKWTAFVILVHSARQPGRNWSKQSPTTIRNSPERIPYLLHLHGVFYLFYASLCISTLKFLSAAAAGQRLAGWLFDSFPHKPFKTNCISLFTTKTSHRAIWGKINTFHFQLTYTVVKNLKKLWIAKSRSPLLYVKYPNLQVDLKFKVRDEIKKRNE